jgi:hypothetical protein
MAILSEKIFVDIDKAKRISSRKCENWPFDDFMEALFSNIWRIFAFQFEDKISRSLLNHSLFLDFQPLMVTHFPCWRIS